jgi:folate-dependent phosphoribosylglycinamide formyltransferase PurN
MKKLVYDPQKSSAKMTVVCFVSGSGTNYREIVKKNPDANYLVFTNRPGCAGVVLAMENRHEVIELSHVPYLKTARKKYGAGKIPRNCSERVQYEQDAFALIETNLKTGPDLICWAGYDQWVTDWMVDRFYPKILNVHPGDTTKGYDGLHWVPTAKAILAGDKEIRSTLFVVDKGEDTGPVLVQSAPLIIQKTLESAEFGEQFGKIKRFIDTHNIDNYIDFEIKANLEQKVNLKIICEYLQNALKISGDWKIYPFAVHDLIARGSVELDGKTVYVHGKKMPEYGYRLA